MSAYAEKVIHAERLEEAKARQPEAFAMFEAHLAKKNKHNEVYLRCVNLHWDFMNENYTVLPELVKLWKERTTLKEELEAETEFINNDETLRFVVNHLAETLDNIQLTTLSEGKSKDD